MSDSMVQGGAAGGGAGDASASQWDNDHVKRRQEKRRRERELREQQERLSKEQQQQPSSSQTRAAGAGSSPHLPRPVGTNMPVSPNPEDGPPPPPRAHIPTPEEFQQTLEKLKQQGVETAPTLAALSELEKSTKKGRARGPTM